MSLISALAHVLDKNPLPLLHLMPDVFKKTGSKITGKWPFLRTV